MSLFYYSGNYIFYFNKSMLKKNEKVIMKIEGRLDTITAPQLQNEINSSSSDVKELFLDMEKLEYVSSAGLRVILLVQKKMARLGSLKLVSVCETIMEVFEITSFNDILDIE